MTVIARQVSSLTHADLTHRAYRWLLGAGKCVVAVKERGAFDNGTPSTIGNEIVDAIGWDWYGKSTMVEVKTSHGDFLVDARKGHRKSADGMGRRRYFMCPQGVIVPEEVPEGWGLLYATAYQVRVIRNADDRAPSDSCERKEKALLVELMRRVYVRGFAEVVVTPINDYMPYSPGQSPHKRMRARLNLFCEAHDSTAGDVKAGNEAHP